MASDRKSLSIVTCEWGRRCRKWATSDGSIYSRSLTAPSPSKNFVQVYITSSEVIYRVWKILPPTRADANQTPSEWKCDYSEFQEDEKIRGEIERIMGANELAYIDNLISGTIDFPNRLQRKILLRILFNLDLISLSRMGKVNKLFRELCSCDTLWSKIYMDHTKQPITQELLMFVDQKGWKEVFFMNKLQLQVHMRRQAGSKEKPSTFFLTSQQQGHLEDEDDDSYVQRWQRHRQIEDEDDDSNIQTWQQRYRHIEDENDYSVQRQREDEDDD